MSSRFQVIVGGVPVGGGAPVVVQSMTNTRTDDVEATLEQIRALVTAGAQIVRVAVPDREAVQALRTLVTESPVPLVADVHFDHTLAVASLQAGAAGVRINPGNIGGWDVVRLVVEAAAEHGAVIRVGVNSGSLQRDLREMEEHDPAGALVESAVRSCALLEELDFERIKVSAKSSSPLVTIAANRALAKRLDYPQRRRSRSASGRGDRRHNPGVAHGRPGGRGPGGAGDPAHARRGSPGPAGVVVPHVRQDSHRPRAAGHGSRAASH
jgi:(E)-4-hydroxy-3-methylbut-2-enyl-diphosphate synthase